MWSNGIINWQKIGPELVQANDKVHFTFISTSNARQARISGQSANTPLLGEVSIIIANEILFNAVSAELFYAPLLLNREIHAGYPIEVIFLKLKSVVRPSLRSTPNEKIYENLSTRGKYANRMLWRFYQWRK